MIIIEGPDASGKSTLAHLHHWATRRRCSKVRDFTRFQVKCSIQPATYDVTHQARPSNYVAVVSEEIYCYALGRQTGYLQGRPYQRVIS